MKQKA